MRAFPAGVIGYVVGMAVANAIWLPVNLASGDDPPPVTTTTTLPSTTTSGATVPDGNVYRDSEGRCFGTSQAEAERRQLTADPSCPGSGL